MKTLIVNGDDFGASSGVNRGMIEAHCRGILTSASLMVEAPGSAEAARLSAEHPDLGVGLHVVVGAGEDGDEVERQLDRFVELTGRPPTHIDAHRNVHHSEPLRPAFLAAAEQHGLRLRGYCDVHLVSSFYGQWDGTTHLEHIRPTSLLRILEDEMQPGLNELCCHPGYVDGDLHSSYTLEREVELQTLCDREVAALLNDRGIRLTTFADGAGP
ncbi:MAG: ChbG/HpnK family deacetylase [Thermoleophilaceae bacterium]|nr:ChbG/HpnK family deacetylase [Thermoleophilaceae bacterium]